MKKKNLIPPDHIHPNAKKIAIAWIENYTPHGSIMPEIAQKQKLASDIQNFANEYAVYMLKNYRATFGMHRPQPSWKWIKQWLRECNINI